jgi:hypothetical protein
MSSYFGTKYKEKYGFAAKFNRNIARWNWDGMLEDMTEVQLMELIDYYFTTVSVNQHSLEWFFYNYDKLLETKEVIEKDIAEQAILREATRIRTEEWRKRHGNN